MECFSGIPYELSDNTERHYQAIFYVVFTLPGQFVETEVRSARGRADAVVKAGVNFSKETRNVERYLVEG